MTRAVAALFACLLLAAGCARDTGPDVPGAGSTPRTTTLGDDPTPRASSSTTPAAAPQPVRTPDGPAAPQPPSSDPSATSDRGTLGTYGFLYLNRHVPRILVEVDAVRGMAPASGTIDLLLSRLRSVVDKPDGITVLSTQTIPGSPDGTWTNADIAASEAAHRDHHSSGARMVLYLQFLDGGYEQDDVFGVAYTASAAAIFVQPMRDAATLLVDASALERATVVHEAGHLLSLINLGYRSPRDHEDPDHANHSSNPGSVMFWAVDNVGILGVLNGQTQPPTAFDADDRADLNDVRTGKLR